MSEETLLSFGTLKINLKNIMFWTVQSSKITFSVCSLNTWCQVWVFNRQVCVLVLLCLPLWVVIMCIKKLPRHTHVVYMNYIVIRAILWMKLCPPPGEVHNSEAKSWMPEGKWTCVVASQWFFWSLYLYNWWNTKQLSTMCLDTFP